MADQPLHLNIYHLDRSETAEYGQHAEHVVIARTELAARIIAGQAARGENGIEWATTHTTVTRLGQADDVHTPGIILSRYLGD